VFRIPVILPGAFDVRDVETGGRNVGMIRFIGASIARKPRKDISRETTVVALAVKDRSNQIEVCLHTQHSTAVRLVDLQIARAGVHACSTGAEEPTMCIGSSGTVCARSPADRCSGLSDCVMTAPPKRSAQCIATSPDVRPTRRATSWTCASRLRCGASLYQRIEQLSSSTRKGTKNHVPRWQERLVVLSEHRIGR
jgi:hypothetical protein